MKFTWLISVVKLVPLIIGAVQAVEKVIRDKHGKDKQDAAIGIIESMIPAFQLALPEGAFQSDEFQKLLREFIDDYVAIENFIAKKNSELSNEQ